MREFIIGLLLMGFVFSLANPSAVYCEDLGYEYKIVETDEGQDGVCVLPDESEVNPWDFLAGTVGEEYSYCAQNGYELVAGEGMAECILPDGSNASISELMDLSGGGGVLPVPDDGEIDGTGVPEPVVISAGENTGSENDSGGEEETGEGENESSKEEGSETEEGDEPTVLTDEETCSGVTLDTHLDYEAGEEPADENGWLGGVVIVVLAFAIVGAGAYWLIIRK